MNPLKEEPEKPLVVLVHGRSFFRGWMERSLGEKFRLHVFSRFDEALAFVRSTSHLDVLITELDIAFSVMGGCNIAREVSQRFPKSSILVFSNGASDDHRFMMFHDMKSVRFLSKPFDAFFLVRRVKDAMALAQKGKNES